MRSLCLFSLRSLPPSNSATCSVLPSSDLCINVSAHAVGNFFLLCLRRAMLNHFACAIALIIVAFAHPALSFDFDDDPEIDVANISSTARFDGWCLLELSGLMCSAAVFDTGARTFAMFGMFEHEYRCALTPAGAIRCLNATGQLVSLFPADSGYIQIVHGEPATCGEHKPVVHLPISVVHLLVLKGTGECMCVAAQQSGAPPTFPGRVSLPGRYAHIDVSLLVVCGLGFDGVITCMALGTTGDQKYVLANAMAKQVALQPPPHLVFSSVGVVGTSQIPYAPASHLFVCGMTALGGAFCADQTAQTLTTFEVLPVAGPLTTMRLIISSLRTSGDRSDGQEPAIVALTRLGSLVCFRLRCERVVELLSRFWLTR
jgi:hypothetical protein